MGDVHDKKTRSFNMSRIRHKNTKPELLVRRYLFAEGFRFKLHDKTLAGKPDLVLPRYKTVIFVHGCFWHGHEPCSKFVLPKTRADWWREKIGRTRTLDTKNTEVLRDQGWSVLSVYECELLPKVRATTLEGLCRDIKDFANGRISAA